MVVLAFPGFIPARAGRWGGCGVEAEWLGFIPARGADVTID